MEKLSVSKSNVYIVSGNRGTRTLVKFYLFKKSNNERVTIKLRQNIHFLKQRLGD